GRLSEAHERCACAQARSILVRVSRRGVHRRRRVDPAVDDVDPGPLPCWPARDLGRARRWLPELPVLGGGHVALNLLHDEASPSPSVSTSSSLLAITSRSR